MTDEVQSLAGVDPVPEQVETAVPETEVKVPEIVDEANQEKTEVKKLELTQDELDALVGKRLAKAQRKWEREQAASLAERQRPSAVEVPPLEQFESPDAYAEALAIKKAEELLSKRERDRQLQDIRESYHEREEAARDKYDDFEQVAYNPSLRITETMVEAIQSSDVGPDLAYYLGSNAKEAARISQLSPILQAREIGKLEAKLASNPPTKPTTSAPPPITPVNSRTSGTQTFDTTDPRSIKSMSTSEWIEADRLRQIKKMEAQRNR